MIGHEGAALMNDISVLMKETAEGSLPLLPREGTTRRRPSEGLEGGSCQTHLSAPRSRTSSLQTVEDRSLLLISQPVNGMITAA